MKKDMILKQAKEINDIEEWLDGIVLDYLQKHNEDAFPLKTLSVIIKKHTVITLRLSVIFEIIVRLLKKDKIRVFDYKGAILIAAK